jgi:hypothetical protein
LGLHGSEFVGYLQSKENVVKPILLRLVLGLTITLALGQQLSTLACAQTPLSSASNRDPLIGLRATAVQEIKAPEGGAGLSIVLEPASAAKLREFSKTAAGKRLVLSTEGQELAVLTMLDPIIGDSLLLTGVSSAMQARMMRSTPLMLDIRLE